MNFSDYINDHIKVVSESEIHLSSKVKESIDMILGAFQSQNKILICGNGGSAADSQHFAAEFLNTLNKNSQRPGLPAIALTTNTSAITAWANDFSFDDIFARQIDALGRKDDILIVLSTSGTSKNVLEGIIQAKAKGMKIIALTGVNGISGNNVDIDLKVSSSNTQYIQEMHIVIYHYISFMIEKYICNQDPKESTS